MPIYEFQCTDCGQPFEELVRSAEAVADVECPSCGSQHVRKKVSIFASKTSGGGSASYSTGSSCSTGGT